MASSSKICTECGLEALIEDEGKTVCAECGAISVESKLVSGDTDYFNFVETEQLMSRKNKYASESEVLHQGRMKTIEICSKLHFDSCMKEAAAQKFVQLFYNKAFMCLPRGYKAALTAVCVYIEGRLNDFPILIFDVLSSICKEDQRKFGYVLHKAREILKIDYTSLSYVNSITVLLCKTEFPAILYKQVIEVCRLMDLYWKERSYNLLSTIYPCAYITWLASDHCSDKNITFKKFCSHFALKFTLMGDKLAKKSITFLIQMAEQLPWVTKKPTRKNVLEFLPDIIKYPRSLVNKSKSEKDLPVLPSHWKTVKRDRDVTFEESEERDKKIRKENPNLHDSDLKENEFQDEMNDFLKTPAEIEFSTMLRNLNKEEKV